MEVDLIWTSEGVLCMSYIE